MSVFGSFQIDLHHIDTHIKAGLPYEQVKAENGAVLDKVIFMPIVQLHKKGAEAIIDSYKIHMKPAAYELVFEMIVLRCLT